MARISEEEINAVRARADIVDVIGHYIQVSRKGKSYTALCPFHDDHTPSMSISPDKQIYKCFVCGNGGNVFTFVQNYEKVPFTEAVVRVADLVGFQLSHEPAAYEVHVDPARQVLYRAMNEMISFCMYQIDLSSASSVREYLDKRGLNEEVRKVFQIGYNPGGDAVYRFLHTKGYSDADLIRANIVRNTMSGIHDVFDSRITFPIHDQNGNPIGFSARTMNPADRSKYINTNETDLFVKGNIVYNIHRAKASARRSGKIYVCEGVTDVIAFYRAGLQNAVCTLGTACTPRQIQLLRSAAARIVFCYDGDDAGQAATFRAGKMAREAGCSISVVLNRTGRDPDEIILQDGPDGLKEMVSREVSWIEFVISYLKDRTNMDSYMEKKEFVRKAMEEVSLLEDETDRRYFTEQLSSITGIHLDYAQPRKLPQRTEPVKNRIRRGEDRAEELILKMMMHSPEAVRRFENELGYLNDPVRQNLAMMMIDHTRTAGSVDAVRLIDETEDQNARNLIVSLIQDDYGGYDEKVMDGAVRRVKIAVLSSEADAYKEQLNSDMNIRSREILLNKYSSCLKELRRYIDEES